MENKLVIGILNIVEDKLREFNIQIPDEDREDSKDPIVGYQYAELHDRIKEYLEDAGVMEEGQDFVKPSGKVSVHGISIVNSEGFMDGTESCVQVFGSLQEGLDYAFGRYKETVQGYNDDFIQNGLGERLRCMSPKAFSREMMLYGYVTIQLEDHHINFERFVRELDVPKSRSIDSLIQDASSRSVGGRADGAELDLEH